MRAGIALQIILPRSTFHELVRAAQHSAMPAEIFAREIIESDVASRRLAILPPSPVPDAPLTQAERNARYRRRRARMTGEVGEV